MKIFKQRMKKQHSEKKAKQPRGTAKLKIIPLGGLEEVGRNMTLFEYKNDILIIDMGLQFPEEDMPGIDYIIPNISYLRGKEKNIKGVIITHGHYDHIGAIPHLIPRLRNPLILGTKLTLGLIKKRQDDFKNQKKLNLKTVNLDDQITLGPFKVKFFNVSHNIPDSIGIIIDTPEGIIVHTGDFKFDLGNFDENNGELAKLSRLNDQNVMALLSDSTNAEAPGHQLSEKEIEKTLEQIFEKVPGRLIIGTFASLLGRIQQIIMMAEKFEKKLVVEGYSMRTNIEIAHQLGYLKYKKGTLIPIKEARRLTNKKIVILATGAQGEDRAALMRIANREHRNIKVEKDDTIVFSSSVVPGNERSVQRLKDSLHREGADVIHYQMMDVHAGGHAKQEDLKLMIHLVNPKYFIPIEGFHSFLKTHAKIAESVGVNPKNIFVADNGQIIEFSRRIGKLTSQKVPSSYVMVDGLGVGDVSNIVLRDRQMLSADGMLVIIVTIEVKTGKLIGNPDIISRGFVYMKESKKLIEQTRNKVKKILKDSEPHSLANDTYIKNKIRNDIGQFLFSKTERRPMILPVVIEV